MQRAAPPVRRPAPRQHDAQHGGDDDGVALSTPVARHMWSVATKTRAR